MSTKKIKVGGRDIIAPILLPVELKRSGRFSATWRNNLVNRLRNLGFGRNTPLNEPVVIVVTRVMGPGDNFWRSTDLVKQQYRRIEQALERLNYINNRGRQWVVETVTNQEDSRRSEGPAIEISFKVKSKVKVK